jgi:hypothetical protein
MAANLQAAQAAFPLVTGLALTDYQDWAAIQQAINTAALNNKGGVVALYSGEVAVINKQIDLYPGQLRLPERLPPGDHPHRKLRHHGGGAGA